MSCKECGKELHKWLERYTWNDSSKIINYNLPSMDNMPRHVQLHLEQVKEFRDDYQRLSEFSAWVCGVSVKELCVGNMIFHIREIDFLKHKIKDLEANGAKEGNGE